MWRLDGRLAMHVVLLAVLLGLAQAGPPGAGVSTLPPFTCFFGGECSSAKATLQNTTTSSLATCLKAAFPSDTDKRVVLPGSPAFEHARMMNNVRFPKAPAVVVYAHKTSDVQAAVKCAYKTGVRVTVAGGRHSYGGWSVVSDYLVVDTSNMTEARVTGRQGKVLTAEVGPGNTNALLISQLYKQGYTTAGTIVGQCPSVGVSGYILGGGQGDLSRMFGLACDQVLGLEMVNYKGEVVTANAQQNSDLLWAACGGGGGLGVITRWTVKAHDLGNEPFSRIVLGFNPKTNIDAMLKLQDFIMSEKTDLRFSGGGGGLAGVNLYFAGPLDTAMRLLKEGGMLDPALLDTTKPSKVWKSQAHINKDPVQVDAASIPHMPSSGVEAWTFHNYYETVMMAECAWVAGDAGGLSAFYIRNAAKYGLGPDKSCKDVATLNKYKALAATRGSMVTKGTNEVWLVYGLINACRLLPPLNKKTWEALQAVSEDPRCANKGSANVQELAQQLREDPDGTYYCYALKNNVLKPGWNHLLGGAVAAVPSSATAYPWRKAISPLCFDGGVFSEMVEADGSTLKKSMDWTPPGQRGSVTLSPVALIDAIKSVQEAYTKVLYRELGEDTARRAYYNYFTDQVKDYEAAYFGPNNKRLQQIKAKWDPEGLFSKPFTVQPAASTK